MFFPAHRAPPSASSTIRPSLTRCLGTGTTRPFNDLAKAEKLNTSFVTHALRLALLAPDIVEAVLNGTQPPTLQFQQLGV